VLKFPLFRLDVLSPLPNSKVTISSTSS